MKPEHRPPPQHRPRSLEKRRLKATLGLLKNSLPMRSLHVD